jgi:hypothetical protein
MNASKGALYFHRLFSVKELGFGNPEPFVGPLIREFLKIGEAVAGRWIEMPNAVLLFQIVEGKPDSGAVYLYDRPQQVFYMLCFDGEDDHLTVEDFNRLLSEYNLLRYAEQPSLVQSQPPMLAVQSYEVSRLLIAIPEMFDVTAKNCAFFTSKGGLRWYDWPSHEQSPFQSAGSA